MAIQYLPISLASSQKQEHKYAGQYLSYSTYLVAVCEIWAGCRRSAWMMLVYIAQKSRTWQKSGFRQVPQNSLQSKESNKYKHCCSCCQAGKGVERVAGGRAGRLRGGSPSPDAFFLLWTSRQLLVSTNHGARLSRG